jgi:hypothetical protein
VRNETPDIGGVGLAYCLNHNGFPFMTQENTLFGWAAPRIFLQNTAG